MPRNSGNNQDQAILLRRSITLNVVLGVVILLLAAVIIYGSMLQPRQYNVYNTYNNSTSGIQQQNSTSSQGNFAGINQPFNASELAGINNEPLSYYEAAGQMLLNGTLQNEVVLPGSPGFNSIFVPSTTLIINGKPTVIYIGAISCIYCGENRWAMALALGSLGNFSTLYTGYSSLGDGDVATVYWAQNNYTTASGATFGNSYNSSYVNFISAEYDSPISGGFQFASTGIQYFVQRAPNATYLTAMQFMNSSNLFEGTPFTYWGSSVVAGADAVIFGNTTPTSVSSLPLAQMSHAQIIDQFKSFNDSFAWSEYAAADVYAASACRALGSNATAPICNLPAIKTLISDWQ